MLTEDDVVDAVCSHLQRHGFHIEQRCTTNDRGEDIVAAHPTAGIKLRVEAKGETSNDQKSARFGKTFSSAQISDHVAKAVYTALATLDAHSAAGERVGVAFPDTRLHRKYVSRIDGVLRTLAVAVFWVQPDRRVTVESTWTL